MKIRHLLLVGLVASSSAAERGTVDTLREAVAGLMGTYGERYAGGADFLQRIDALGSQPPPHSLSALRREALLSHPLLDGGQILLLERDPKPKGLPQNWQGNESLHRGEIENRIALLSGLPDQVRLKSVLEPDGRRMITDVELHPEGDRILFSMVGDHNRWRIFEMELGGGEPRVLPLINEPDVDNYDACYLPNGNIIFTSTATYTGVPCVGGNTEVANIHLYQPESGGIRRLSFDQEHNWNPTVLPDGRVMYLRWEYSDLPHSNSRILFQMNPDGTNQTELYGSNSYFPNSFFYARPVPGHPSRVIGIATGHHGVARAGRLLILDPDISRREAEGVVHEFPHRGRKVEAIVKDQLVKDVWPQFLMPWPLDEEHVLVSCKPDPKSPWGIYLVDVFDNMTLIHEVLGRGLFEPMLLAKQTAPPIIPDRVDLTKTEASVLLSDIYQGPGLEGIPRGTVKRLRVVEYYFSMRGGQLGGMLGSIGMDGPWDVRRVLGSVPVEEDGSAHFTIPAQRPVMVQPLDEKGQALQTMRSWFTGMPGERMSCVGCHAGQEQAPPPMPSMAALRKPTPIEPSWHAPVRGFSFEREVQPVLDRHCTSCHGDDQGDPEPGLTGGRPVTDWKSGISGNAYHLGGRLSMSYAELHRYIRRPGIESDMRILSPMDYHFSTTELGRLLAEGHHGVKLDRESFERIVTWADLNAPYHGTWGEIAGDDAVSKKLDRALELRQRTTAPGPLPDYETIPELPAYDTTPVEPGPPTTTPQHQVTVQANAGPVGRRAIDLGGGVSLELVRVPGGEFNGTDIKPFWIGRTEVTNAQLRRLLPGHDSRDESRHGYQFGRRGYDLNSDRQPAVRVSWNEAQTFIAKLGEAHGLMAALPTGRQWEWACRAGSTTAFPFGDADADYSQHANLGDKRLSEFAACTARDNYSRADPLKNPNRYDDWIPRDDRHDDGGLVSMEVGSYQANAWSLQDMIGNVWEWTADGAEDGKRIARGGSWYDRPQCSTISDRVVYQPYQRVFNVGLRIVLTEAPASASR